MKNSFYSHKASMLTAIGNTPIVQLLKVVPPECADIYVKLEFFNPTGAYKDRMALASEGVRGSGQANYL